MVSGREPVSAARAANGFARRQSRTRCFLEAATNAKVLARLLESDLRKAFSGESLRFSISRFSTSPGAS
jgi:hypothetical protein